MLGLFALQISSLYGVAVSVTLVVGLTMVASLTLLPAMLGFLGPKVLRRGERTSLARQGRQVEQAGGFWLRWAEGLGRRPLIPAVLALAVIVILAIPVLSFRTALLDASTDPPSSTTYQAYQLLAKGFGPGFNGPLDVVGQVNSPADQTRFAAFLSAARSEPGVAAVTPPQLSPNGKAEVGEVFPTTGPQDAATTTVLDRLRAGVPQAEAGSTLTIHIGGTTAANQDYSQVTNSKLPVFVAVVVGLSFLLLAIVFRSLLIPLVASIMNVLSFGVALAFMTAAFQFGWGKSLLGFGTAAPTMAWIPALMFAVLFGLSTRLRGLPHQSHARRVDAIRGQQARGDPGPGRDRPGHHRRLADHDPGVRGVHPHRPGGRHADRPRLRRCHLRRRLHHPHRPRPGRDAHARAGQLVAARVAGPAAAPASRGAGRSPPGPDRAPARHVRYQTAMRHGEGRARPVRRRDRRAAHGRSRSRAGEDVPAFRVITSWRGLRGSERTLGL
jgi:MMPL family